jgi:hypothetical protein
MIMKGDVWINPVQRNDTIFEVLEMLTLQSQRGICLNAMGSIGPMGKKPGDGP